MQPVTRDPGQEDASPFCDGCGRPNRSIARFCAHCGANLAGVVQRSAGPVELARTLSVNGERLQARTILEEALAADDADDAIRLAYATTLLQSGEWESGLHHLRQLSPAVAGLPVAQAYVGGALLGLNRVSEAKDTLDDAYTAWPGDFYVLLKRGELYCRLGIYQTAIQALELAAAAECCDPVARDAVRRLLRFARDKSRSGFVRTLPGRAAQWSLKPRLRLPRRSTKTVWGT